MIGIRNIGVHIPETRVPNISKQFNEPLAMNFLKEKLGVLAVARKNDTDKASDLCVLAMQDLLTREVGFDVTAVDCLIVCTQNGDFHLPQTASVLHYKLGVPVTCASFDLALGCSGYVYSLQVAKSFMETNGLQYGLVFTCDPYSEIIDPKDKDTDLVFGDGATVSLLTADAVYNIEKGAYLTDGTNYDYLIKRPGQTVFMNGRGIFNFVMRQVPPTINRCMVANDMKMSDIDLFLLHQGSKYIVDNLVSRMKLDAGKVPYAILGYGNTVSSSIPIMLQDYLKTDTLKTILVCGFGVGLSAAAAILRRVK